jgi:adenylate kinase family enzyme
VRIMVVGTSGSGKSTLARRLSRLLALPQVELDALNWQAGWRALADHDQGDFLRRVAKVAAGEDWVTDGSYTQTWPVLLPRADHVIWLDYPRGVVMGRVVWRSFRRALTGAELWPGTGNREHFRRWLSREHPIRWAWDTMADRRARYEELLAGTRVHRLRHPREAERLVHELCAEKAAEAQREIFV